VQQGTGTTYPDKEKGGWNRAAGRQEEGRALEKLLTVKDVAEILQVKVSVVRWWRRVGKGPPFFRLSEAKGSRLRCTQSGFEEWLERCKEGS
jgi:hypothetical protein